MRFRFKKVICLVLPIILVATVVLTACDFFSGNQKLTTYTINLILNDDNTINGDMTVSYRNNYDIELREVKFHLYPNAFREGAVFKPIDEINDIYHAFPNGVSYGGLEILSVKVNNVAVEFIIDGEDKNILTVPLTRKLMPGNAADIDIEFVLTLPNVRHRFGHSAGVINLGNFYPIAAVYQNGGFVTDPYYSMGDPFFSCVADYEVSITAPSNLTVALSGKKSSQELDGGLTKTTSTLSNARDFAIVLGEFEVLTASYNDTEIRYYFLNDSTAENSMAAALASIKTFSELFGEYPYCTFSVVQTPFLHGGMEYAGLVLISDRLTGDDRIEVIVHEAAHQWWYAIVGNDQVAHAWLDESLAEISTSLFFYYNPQFNISYDNRLANALTYYSLFNSINAQNPNFITRMDRPLGDFNSALEYTQLVYVKGHIMFDTLRTLIGHDAFIGALKSYYEANKFGIATPKHLISAFESATNIALGPFFNSWLSGETLVSTTP